MSEFSIKIQTDNAAFDEDPAYEIARILRIYVTGLNNGDALSKTFRDINGNPVGGADYSEDE